MRWVRCRPNGSVSSCRCWWDTFLSFLRWGRSASRSGLSHPVGGAGRVGHRQHRSGDQPTDAAGVAIFCGLGTGPHEVTVSAPTSRPRSKLSTGAWDRS